ncbi:MAG: hypothetical protein Tsb0033_01230 [Winogradskyella sp.]
MRLFFEIIKSKRKTKKTATASFTEDFKMALVSIKSVLKFEIIKRRITKTATIIKFMGLDLLKMLVIIYCFCIFAIQ